MAGGLSLPRPIPMETIRREGRRRGYRGEELQDFVEIIAIADDYYVEVTTKREAAAAKLAAERAKNRR